MYSEVRLKLDACIREVPPHLTGQRPKTNGQRRLY